MAASLGIKAQDIKVVSVYKGSVVIAYAIEDVSGEIKKYGGLPAMQTLLTTLISSNKIELGAPILSADIGSNPIIVTTSGTSS